MKKKIAVLVSVLLLGAATQMFALGIGVQFDGGFGGWGPTFLISPSQDLHFAVNLGMASDYFHLGVSGDKWIIDKALFDPLHWFLGFGIGAAIGFGDGYFGLSALARLPIGLDVKILDEKLEFILQATPQIGLGIVPFYFPAWNVAGSFGIRYWL